MGREKEGREIFFEHKGIPALYFPGDEAGPRYRVGAPLFALMSKGSIRFNIRVDYKNKYAARKSLYSIREYECTLREGAEYAVFNPIADKDECG
ncbi:MAG: hypothetical protein NTW48_11110 [Chloroflexi bacterium]|nr:hypothetical protein [Chloroflexota bacterium]